MIAPIVAGLVAANRAYHANLDAAREAGLLAAEKCADKAGEPWKEDALEAVRDYAKHGKSFVTEDVRASRPDLEAHDDRAWGAVMQKARKLGYIEACGARAVVSSRGGYKTVWRATQ